MALLIPAMPKMRHVTLKRERIAACVLVLIVLAVVASLRKSNPKIDLDPYSYINSVARGDRFAKPYHEQTTSAMNMTARFQQRYRRMREVCQRDVTRPEPPDARASARSSMPRLLFPTPTSPTVLYCPVPRVATSFLRRVIALSNGMDPTTLNWKERFHVRDVPEGYDKAVLFFFTREPYSRLLSSYINNLWLPNSEFWASLGAPIIGAMREDPPMAELACGSDVTFAELIRFIILRTKMQQPLARLFMPSYQVCRVCSLDYDYIGHMETFSDDVRYILAAVNVTLTPQYDAMEDDANRIIDSYVYHAYATIATGKGQCVSKYLILVRAWRALQIRGLVSYHLHFPLPFQDTERLKRAEFRDILQQAHNQSKLLFHAQDQVMVQSQESAESRGGSRERVTSSVQLQQRKMALASAWHTVPMEDRVRIRELFEKDFKLFGYDPFLEEVFSPKMKLDEAIFDWNTV